ncbi:MerR family transcriptional regulator [Glutamicibacter protophormiae]|uniref:transcriptional regulator FtsR n=1 Tax=Kocuria TaxID=57493 RepID=UPI0006D7C5D3|nr:MULTISPECIES: MerR family transcriptional regulator [Kocuria]MDN5630862.1 MerR family transcriptional regulator [Kocuria sp.]WNB89938.1 MerR family transcriptional regulator [Glutamicibacter protophormiae]
MSKPEQQQTTRLGIGALLRRLQPRFPDLSASKVRFLEDQGLVHPQRTASGYRKYSEEDVERLETVLSLQQERYLPLRVIRDRLDRGLDPAAGSERQVPDATSSPSVGMQPPDDVAAPVAGPPSGRRYTLRELAARSSSEVPLVRELLNHGLIVERSGEFDDRALAIAEAAGRLSGYGIEPRHLRVLRGASERIVALVDGSVSPLRNRRDPETRQIAVHRAREISSLCLSMMSAMVNAQVDGTVRGLEAQERSGSTR